MGVILPGFEVAGEDWTSPAGVWNVLQELSIKLAGSRINNQNLLNERILLMRVILLQILPAETIGSGFDFGGLHLGSQAG